MAVVQLSDGSLIRRWQASDWKTESACFGSTGEHLFAVHGLPAKASFGEGPRGKIVMLDVATGDKRGWLKGHRNKVRSVLLDPQGSHVLSASSDGTARIWRADLNPGDAKVLEGFGPVRQAIFAPDGERILVTSGASKNRKGWKGFGMVYDASTGERLAVLSEEKYQATDVPVRHGIGKVLAADYSNDGQRVLTVSEDRHVRLIDPKSSVDLLTLPQEKWPVASKLAFTPVRVWDAKTGRELFALEGLKMSVAWARFTPDGERIITLCQRRHSYTDLQMKDDEFRVLGKGGGMVNDDQVPQIHVWDGHTGQLLMTLRDLQNPHIDLSDGGQTPLALSPDGKHLAITELTGMVNLEAMKRYTMPGDLVQ